MLIWNAYPRMIDALAFSPDGEALAVGGYRLACRLIDAGTGERLWTVPGTQPFGLSIGFTPGGEVLCKSGPLTVIAGDGAPVRKYGGWCRAFGAAPDGSAAFVADGGHHDVLRHYDLRDGSATGEAELESGSIKRVAVSPDGDTLGVVGCRRFYLLDAGTFEVVALDAHRALSNGAFALAFSPCARTLVFSAGRTLFVWDVATAREVHRLSLEAKHFRDAAFTPDGRKLVTVSLDGTARVWDTATWACERAFAWDIGPLRAVAVSPDGTRAATAGDAGRVVVWDLEL